MESRSKGFIKISGLEITDNMWLFLLIYLTSLYNLILSKRESLLKLGDDLHRERHELINH